MKTTFTVDQNRWSKLGIFDQMGNIYSEIGRSFKTKGQPDVKNHQAAMARAIDLFDSTIQSLIKKKSPKAKEVLRAKEQFLGIISEKDPNRESLESLERYFMQFAIASRINR